MTLIALLAVFGIVSFVLLLGAALLKVASYIPPSQERDTK